MRVPVQRLAASLLAAGPCHLILDDVSTDELTRISAVFSAADMYIFKSVDTKARSSMVSNLVATNLASSFNSAIRDKN